MNYYQSWSHEGVNVLRLTRTLYFGNQPIDQLTKQVVWDVNVQNSDSRWPTKKLSSTKICFWCIRIQSVFLLLFIYLLFIITVFERIRYHLDKRCQRLLFWHGRRKWCCWAWLIQVSCVCRHGAGVLGGEAMFLFCCCCCFYYVFYFALFWAI